MPAATLSLLGLLLNPAVTGITDPWAATSGSGLPGEERSYDCPANGHLEGPVWGSGVYTEDSTVCVAAVHAGLIEVERGGQVTLRFAPGRRAYPSETRHGVRTEAWGEWALSFYFPASGVVPSHAGELSPGESGRAAPTRQVGDRYPVECAPGEVSGTVWGTDVYTDDSSVCAAAVHAGVLDPEQGGSVTVEVAPGRAFYPASVKNGIVSSPWGSWGGSFRFPAQR